MTFVFGFIAGIFTIIIILGMFIIFLSIRRDMEQERFAEESRLRFINCCVCHEKECANGPSIQDFVHDKTFWLCEECMNDGWYFRGGYHCKKYEEKENNE